MPSTMRFIPQLTEFLRSNDVIYTLREYKYITSQCFVPGVGECRRTLVGELSQVSEADLQTTVVQSGFPDAAAWLKMLRTFVRDPHRVIYMYRVEVVKSA